MTTKKTSTSFKAEKPPAVVLDATPKEDAKPIDSTLCQCQDVARRWDGDGVVERVDGVTFYACQQCGKKYSA